MFEEAQYNHSNLQSARHESVLKSLKHENFTLQTVARVFVYHVPFLTFLYHVVFPVSGFCALRMEAVVFSEMLVSVQATNLKD